MLFQLHQRCVLSFFVKLLRPLPSHWLVLALSTGVPSCANGELMNGVLRKKWGWDGFIVSDYDGWANLVTPQSFAPNYTAAAAIGINAGMDQEGGGTQAIEKLPDAVKAGLTTAEAVATSFRRLFAARIRLGM